MHPPSRTAVLKRRRFIDLQRPRRSILRYGIRQQCIRQDRDRRIVPAPVHSFCRGYPAAAADIWTACGISLLNVFANSVAALLTNHPT
jgi:hypothetical protein